MGQGVVCEAPGILGDPSECVFQALPPCLVACSPSYLVEIEESLEPRNL